MIDRNGRPERPIITFQCGRAEQGRGGQGSSKHGVVAHWTRLSQNGSGEREREEGERAGNYCAENHSGHETDIAAVCGYRARQKISSTVVRNTDHQRQIAFAALLCIAGGL